MSDKPVIKKNLAKKLLSYLGNDKPTPEHVEKAKNLLVRIKVESELDFDQRLSEVEAQCLYFVAQGYTAPEMTELLGIKLSTVESYQKEIRRKLKCRTIAQAVHVGIKFSYLPPWQGEKGEMLRSNSRKY